MNLDSGEKGGVGSRVWNSASIFLHLWYQLSWLDIPTLSLLTSFSPLLGLFSLFSSHKLLCDTFHQRYSQSRHYSCSRRYLDGFLCDISKVIREYLPIGCVWLQKSKDICLCFFSDEFIVTVFHPRITFGRIRDYCGDIGRRICYEFSLKRWWNDFYCCSNSTFNLVPVGVSIYLIRVRWGFVRWSVENCEL